MRRPEKIQDSARTREYVQRMGKVGLLTDSGRVLEFDIVQRFPQVCMRRPKGLEHAAR